MTNQEDKIKMIEEDHCETQLNTVEKNDQSLSKNDFNDNLEDMYDRKH